MNSSKTAISNNGVVSPTRIAPLQGNPKYAAHQNNVETSVKLNNLNKVVKGGAQIPVNPIKPIYKNTFTGNQDPNNQQIANAVTSNKAMVQAKGDSVPLVTGGKKIKKVRKTRKTRRIKKKKNRKTRK
jgi:hypothetical protein